MPGGGVAAVVRDSLTYTVCENFSHPDLLVLDLDSFFVVCAYLQPAYSQWQKWSPVDPSHRLAQAVAFCSSHPHKPLLLLGDLNACTRSLQAGHSPLPRSSLDEVLDACGSWLLDLCTQSRLQILNGTTYEHPSPGAWTSFQWCGCSVVDYAIVSPALLSLLSDFRVLPPGRDSGHAQLSLTVFLDVHHSLGLQPGCSCPLSSLLHSAAPPTSLDASLARVLATNITAEDATRALYGPVYFTASPVAVYIAVSQAGDISGMGLYWGEGCHVSFRMRATVNGAALAAVAAVLLRSKPHRPLILYTSSEYAIRTYCFWAGKHALQGWPCEHADILKVATALLRNRAAGTVFRVPDSKETNAHWRSAVDFAKSAARDGTTHVFCPPSLSALPHWPYPVSPPIPDAGLTRPKVSTTLSPLAASPAREGLPLHPPLDVDADSASHRGRAGVRKEMWLNMRKLMLCDSPSDFWKLVRGWTDDKLRSLPFPLESLRSAFQSRMNPPAVLPSSFDARLYALHHLTSNVIPPCTIDITPNRYFSRPFVDEDVDWAKCRVRKHSLNSAKGVDGISYDRILNFPTPDLTSLFNMCVEKCDVPQIWLTTLLVGILKPGRSPLAPDNYRLIALECCLLKFMTLLVDRRLDSASK